MDSVIKLVRETILQSRTSLAWTIFGIICITSYCFMTFTKKAKLLRKFPSPPRFPLIGSIIFMLTTPEGFADRVALGIKHFGNRFVFWLGHKPYLVLTEAKGIQKILSSTTHIEKGSDYVHFQWIFGNGLITAPGDIWREDRKLLSPSFKYQEFGGFLDYFNKHSKILVSKFDRLCGTKGCEPKEHDLYPLISKATIDFISESAFSLPSTEYEMPDEFLDAVNMTLESFRSRIQKPWLVAIPMLWDLFGCGKQEKLCTEMFTRIVKEIVEKRKEFLAKTEDDGSTKPFIDPLLTSYSDITGHIVTIFGAGFETTARSMTNALFLLAQNPECQAKVHDEIDRVFESKGNDVTFDEIAELKYLELVIKETLRIFPPAPVIIRRPVEDIPLENGQVIPKGVDTIIFIRNLHMDKTVFPKPKVFDPERFLPDECVRRNPYSYIPFSAGPRNCLGLKYAMIQMKCCLSHILRNFKVTTSQKSEDIKLIYGMVLEPQTTIKIALHKRHT